MKEPSPNDYILTKPEDNVITLTNFLYEVQDELEQITSLNIWISAETAKIKKNNTSGHVYLELIDRDNTGKEISKINAKMWSKDANFIITKFESLTGEKLKDGIKCEWLVRLDYNVIYGLSLTITDIKPLWSIGEHEKKKIKIKEQLVKDGLWGKQKILKQPTIYTSIAIVAPSEAAGLGDFLSEAKVWHKMGLIKISLFTSLFEGEKTSASIVTSLKSINDKNEIFKKEHGADLFDLIVILRGGGSKTSLAWLDDLSIAETICNTNIPVWSAIGHEQDNGILDEISSFSCHTPSKAAQKIKESLLNEVNLNIRYFDFIDNEKSKRIEKLEIQIENMYVNAIEYVKNKLNMLENNINNLASEASLLGPQSTLQRGYAIVKDDKGDILKNMPQTKQKVTIIWVDGKKEAQILGDKNDE